MEWREEFAQKGYAVVRGVLPPERIQNALEEAERLRALWRDGDGDGDGAAEAGGVRWLSHQDRAGNRRLRGVQSVCRISPVFDSLRTCPEVGAVIAAQLGGDIVNVVETLFFKAPGEGASGIAVHRDAEFRQPPEHYRDLANSYVQMGLALDPHGPENGGLVLAPGSHKDAQLSVTRAGSVMGVEALAAASDDSRPLALEPVRLDPGDAVLWSALTLHGSPPNLSTKSDRRFYVCGFMRQSACDAGWPAFSAGRGVPAPQEEASVRGRAGAP